MQYISIIVMALMLPLLYISAIYYCKSDFAEEGHKKLKPMTTLPEIGVILLSEFSLIRLWYAMDKPDFTIIEFDLMYIMLVTMTILFFTDLWEHKVPNKILLCALILWGITVGLGFLLNLQYMLGCLFEYSIGFLFCAISFGLCYIISHGKLGAGDVKLALLMGICIPANYVTSAILFGCIVSAIVSIVLLLIKKITRKDFIPFVPFLYIGLIIRYWMG